MSRNSKLHRTRRFDMIWARHLKLITKLGVAALALGALATSGRAQSRYEGKFTLPFETRWGSPHRPDGDYTFTLPPGNSRYTLYIRGQAGSAIIMATTSDDRVDSNRAQLNLANIAGVQTVQTFEGPELNLTLIYAPPTTN